MHPLAQTIPSAPPATSDLEIAWVHGYNPFCGGHPISYLRDGSICYPVGSMLVHYDKTTHKQRLLRHDGKVTAAVVSDTEDIAVGCSIAEEDATVVVIVWDIRATERLATLQCPAGSRAASAVALSAVSSLVLRSSLYE